MRQLELWPGARSESGEVDERVGVGISAPTNAAGSHSGALPPLGLTLQKPSWLATITSSGLITLTFSKPLIILSLSDLAIVS